MKGCSMSRLLFLLCPLVATQLANRHPTNGKNTVDYQQKADKAKWRSIERVGNDFRGCVAHELEGYDVQVLRRTEQRWMVTIRILDKGRQVYTWEGHLDSVFLESGGVLYYADYYSLNLKKARNRSVHIMSI